jgi:hypothetical protein
MQLVILDVADAARCVTSVHRSGKQVAAGNRTRHCGVVDPNAVLELYGLPPEQFTAARNQLAKALKDAGDIAGSAEVKALRKPTIAAWLANRLVRIAPDQVDELTAFGGQLREAHESGDGALLRRLTPRRHELVQRLVNVATADAAANGRLITDDAAERLTETLDASLVDPSAAQLLRTGRLNSALHHVGFGVVDESGEPAAVQPLKKAAKATPRAKAPTQKAAKTFTAADKAPGVQLLRRRRAELAQRLREAQAEYVAAENERLAAESEMDANAHHITDMQTAIERLTDELERARRELRTAQGRTRKLEKALTIAARTAAGAKRRLDAQQQWLDAFNE